MSNAGIYVRISKDSTGEGAGVDRQESDSRAYAHAHGIPVAGVYRDNDLSAFRKGIVRPAFDRLLNDAALGVIDTVLCYRVDRIARAAREWAKVLPLVDDLGLRVVGVGDGVDSATPGGRLILGVLAEVARDESSRISQRVSRAARQKALDGKRGAGAYRPFGHSPDCTSEVEDEAVAIRTAVDRLLAGVSLGAIAREWNAAGIKTTTGRPWTATKVRQLLNQRRLQGARMVDGVPHYGGIAPIVKPELQDALIRKLSLNTPPGRTAAHVLSGILHCGSCGKGMNGAGEGMYDCKHCYKSIKRDRAERFVDEEVVRFLASSVALRAAMQDLAPESPNGNTLVEQNALRERLKALTEDFYLYAKIPESIYHSTVDSINSRILELEDSLVRENQIPLTSFDPDDYLEMDPADKRAFLKLLFDAIIVRPDGTSRRDDRLVYVYSEAASAPETD